jgi:beta-galactosidase
MSPDQDITFPWWASTAETWWKLCAPNDWWMGGYVWTGFDYRGEPTPYQWPNINSHFGIMDMCGFPRKYLLLLPVMVDRQGCIAYFSALELEGQGRKPIDVWVNTSADNVELFLNGKSLGKKDMARNSHLQWAVDYEPGTLEAVAYKKARPDDPVGRGNGSPQKWKRLDKHLK